MMTLLEFTSKKQLKVFFFNGLLSTEWVLFCMLLYQVMAIYVIVSLLQKLFSYNDKSQSVKKKK